MVKNKWDEHFWFVIETIVSRNDSLSLETLKLLGNYLPCRECKTHFADFIVRNPQIDSDWIKLLKYEISLTQRKPGKCCKGPLKK